MRAVVDINENNAADYKNAIRARVLMKVWPNCKFIDYDTRRGQLTKDFMRQELGMNSNAFDNMWTKIKQEMNELLRNQRGYVMQQMKTRHFGK